MLVLIGVLISQFEVNGVSIFFYSITDLIEMLNYPLYWVWSFYSITNSHIMNSHSLAFC